MSGRDSPGERHGADRTRAAHVLLYDIDLRDARDGFGGDGRIAALCALEDSRRKWLQQKATVILSAGNFL